MFEKELGEPTVVDKAMPVLEVMADRDRLQVIEELYLKPSTQKELSAKLDLNPGTMSRHMAVLTDVGLVARERSHSPYTLTAPEETLELLRSAARLSIALAQIRLGIALQRESNLEHLAAQQPGDSETQF